MSLLSRVLIGDISLPFFLPQPMPDKEEAKPAPERQPRPLSSEYHKARKQLMLWSAILFIWELVGIDLDTAKDEPGNVGAIVKSLKSRQAVPWALLILVVYFLIKCWIEWAQCHPERRKVLFARIDFYLAGSISFLSIALYAGQTIRKVQFANLGAKALITSIVVVITVALVGFAFLVRFSNRLLIRAMEMQRDQHKAAFKSSRLPKN